MGDVGPAVRRRKLVKKTGLPRHVKDMSKEQLEATIKKKRECNAKALTIVEQMLEAHIEEDWFLDQLKFIDLGHFQDIIEERVLCKLCGYPLCAENLKNLPTQQFRISTKFNKVYDITERKNFCSNQCYKASRFVKNQLLTSPLWLRDKEDIPNFKLLSLESQGTGAGEEIDFGQNIELKSDITNLNKDKFLSVADYTQDSIMQLSRKIDDIEISDNSNVNTQATAKECTKEKSTSNIRDLSSASQEGCATSDAEQKIKEKSCIENEENSLEQKEEHGKNYSVCDSFKVKNEFSMGATVNKDSSTKNCKENSKCIENKKHLEENKCKQKKTHECPEVTSSVILIEKCLHEWFTIESMCFLFGDEKVKDLVSDKGECIKEYYKAVGKSFWDPGVQDQYEALCRKLNIMEIQEQQYDVEERDMKPLPNYNVLKEESLKLDLKIQSFYQGKTDFEMPIAIEKNENGYIAPSCVLPLVDIHAQNALRRRMVLDNLKRVLPDLLCTFGLSSRDISSEVRCLIGSFSLSAHNITFSPPEWNLLGLIIIKMLSIKDIRLKILLESQQGIKYQTMLLMAFQQDGGYLERLMVWLTDMDNMMKK